MIEKFDSIKGFLDLNEGIALYEEVKRVSENNFCVEIGSYCGKSTCFIGQACKENKSKLITIDHHKGSEEQQLGELYFDAEVWEEDETEDADEEKPKKKGLFGRFRS